MSNPINITIPHAMGAEAAADRLKRLDVPGLLTLKEAEIRFTLQMQVSSTVLANIHGTLKVTDDAVTLQTDTPLPDIVDRQIGRVIESKLTEALK